MGGEGERGMKEREDGRGREREKGEGGGRVGWRGW